MSTGDAATTNRTVVLTTFAGLLAALASATPTRAELEVFFAGHGAWRAALSSPLPDRANGGPSRVRFGGTISGDRTVFFEPSEIALEGTVTAGPEFTLFLHGQYQPEDDQAFDLVRGFVQSALDLGSGWQAGLKAGAFFPGISRENRDTGWMNTYTLTNNAGVAWIGEDVRPVGALASIGRRGETWVWSLEGGPFFANDASGEALALGGVALNDIKTPLTGRIRSFDPLNPSPTPKPPREVRPFRELDDRPGFQIKADVQHTQLGALSFLYSDNRGDVGDSSPGRGIWHTRFGAFSAETLLPLEVIFIPTVLAGQTSNRPGLGTRFVTVSGLLARDLGPVRLALRGDVFTQDDIRAAPAVPLDERGYGITAAITGVLGTHHRFAGEILHVRSDRDSLAGGQNLSETMIQTEYRFVF